MVRRYDIVMLTDARLPGGTSASVAEEIRAQAAAGYRTALLQVDSPLVRSRLPFAPRLRACLTRGDAELLLGDEPVEADLLVVRHPTVARSIDPQALPSVRATNRLLIANQAPGVPNAHDPANDRRLRFVPREVDEHLTRWLDAPVDWIPIGPLVREDLARVAPELEQLPDDWVNVIDVDGWRRPRERPLHRIPVIGRHSRDDPMKWPETRPELLRVYPASSDTEVHVLGGATRALELLGGRVPSNWVLYPFGSMPPERFLAAVDVYVYYHHPAWVEAFGRSILEALASGAPTVLPPHFRALFESAVTYAEPDEVPERVRELHGNRRRYRDAADRATSFADERFGHGVHVRRLAGLAEPTAGPDGEGRPRWLPARDTAWSSATAPGDGTPTPSRPDGSEARRRVLFVSSNGAGVGHLMRLMALARHAPDDVQPVFLTFSQGAKVVHDAGYLVEYLASRSICGAPARHWHPFLRARVNELIERYDFRAIVFDGTWPYQGLLDAAMDQPRVGLVWSRRAMWKPGVTNPVLEGETHRFDLVLEPGEFAGDEDRGATRVHRADAVQLGPVTYFAADELLDRDAARAELGLDPDLPAALVNLGAGNINDVSSLLGAVVDRLAREPQLQVRVTRSIIAGRATSLPANVQQLSVYPLARYLAAFDLAFAAAGYNSVHELLLAGVPTAFVPNTETSTDDQAARSRFADRAGVGLHLPDPDPAAIDRAVRVLLDPDRRRRMHERALARRTENGARRGMAAIVELLDSGVADKIPPAALQASIATGHAPGTGAARRPPRPAALGANDASTRHSSPSAPTSPQRSPASPSPARRPRPSRRGRSRLAARISPRRVAARVLRHQPSRALLKRLAKTLPTKARSKLVRVVVGPRSLGPRSATLDVRPLPVPFGKAVDEAAAIRPTPVAIILPPGADGQTVATIVDHTAQLQAAHRSFAPLFVTSDLDFRPFRRYGYLFEYFPRREAWKRVEAADDWIEARHERIRSILQRFGVATALSLPELAEDGPEAQRRLLGALIESTASRP